MSCVNCKHFKFKKRAGRAWCTVNQAPAAEVKGCVIKKKSLVVPEKKKSVQIPEFTVQYY